MKKKLLRLLAATIAVCVIILTIFILIPPSRITEANYERIEKGMTLAEVESMLGEMTYPVKIFGNCLHCCWHSGNGEMIRAVFKDRALVSVVYQRSSERPKGSVEKSWNRMFPQFPWRHYRKPLEWYGDDG